jgi:hypothetical protein
MCIPSLEQKDHHQNASIVKKVYQDFDTYALFFRHSML